MENFDLSPTQHQTYTYIGVVVAQNVQDPDVLGNMQKSFNNFVQTGQMWALLIGLFVGYGFKSLIAR
jgi:hypothetical protein